MSPETLAVLQAHAQAYLEDRRRQFDARVRQDAEMRRLWSLGWSLARIGGHFCLTPSTIARRAAALGLTPRPVSFRRHHAGLSERQMEVYRAVVRKLTAAEAREIALREAA